LFFLSDVFIFFANILVFEEKIGIRRKEKQSST
jgi:hypothetical protein